MGVTKEFDRSKYDDITKRRKYKEEFFDGKKTETDYYTGKILHSNTSAALNKYGRKEYTNHTSDVDHIVPVKTIHNRLKKDPFLSDKDIKEVTNIKQNYRITGSRFNRSKSDDSNISVAFDKGNGHGLNEKSKIVGDHIKASASIETVINLRRAQNIGSEFIEGAKGSLEASAIPLALIGVQNLVKVANGEKEMKEAIKETGEAFAVTAVSGGAIRLTTTALTNTFSNSSTKALQAIGNSNIITQTITISLLVKNSLVSYLNGEINSGQFMEQIGEKGVGMISGIQGALIGQALIPVPVVGAFVGSLLASTVCVEVYKLANKFKQTYKSLNEFADLESRIDVIANSALKEMEKQRNQLKEYIGQEIERWDMVFSAAFDQMVISALNDDVNGVATAFDKILSVFGEDVSFTTYEEFNDFFMDETPILKL
ncbi:hypothetical protein [Bacillus sp. PS06]|uniref:hypothetical protein n=1 Tax=Bacillus sp. PS06 TaxID=2764176 RepID=UPI001781ED7C|nr:hypothetical protein [Bacillus sp. PS06]MBD8069744.1 hypothetical protein [Bacillus sp. PS06]